MIEFTMPALGSDMDEGTLDQWLVSPGDTVVRGQVVAVVETTKAAVEVECWHEGTVGELLVPVGQTVEVGTPLATLLESGERPGQTPTVKPTTVPEPPAVVEPARGDVTPAPRVPLHPHTAAGCRRRRAVLPTRWASTWSP